MNMNDRMRISDSDRDRAATQLRDYYAEGRLTSEELDERGHGRAERQNRW